MNRYIFLNKMIHFVVKIISLSALLLLALIILFMIKESLAFFVYHNIKAIFSWSWRPLSRYPSFGLLPMIAGTILTGLLATIIAFPLAVGCALFISKNLKGKSKYIALSFTDMLAGIPSVVYGFLGLVFIVKYIEQNSSLAAGEGILAATLTLCVMVFPFMLSSFVKAFDLINDRFFLQTQALGTSTWYSYTYLVLDIAKGHLLTGYMLALARALGETMAVMMVIGNSPILPKLLGKGITLSGLIALEMSGSQLGSLHYHSLYLAGFILMLLLLFINYLLRRVNRLVKSNE